MNNRSYRYGSGQSKRISFCSSYKDFKIKTNDSSIMNYSLKENYEELANSIILFATKDYKKYYKRLIKMVNKGELSGSEFDELKGEIYTLERFFHSDYFSMLTQNDPDYIINEIKKVVKKEMEEMEEKKNKTMEDAV